MEKFIQLFQKETFEALEALLGYKSKIEFKEEIDITEIKEPSVFAQLYIKEFDSNMLVILPNNLAISLSDMMMGEDLTDRKLIDDDLDATKEIISNIFGSISITLSSQNEVPLMSFNIENLFYAYYRKIEEKYTKMLKFNIEINNVKSNIIIVIDKNFNKEKNTIKNTANTFLDKIKLPVRVRIDKQKFPIRMLSKLTTGSLIQLNTLSNRPLEILVGEEVIGYGEAVVVDGNYGVKITSLLNEEH